MLRIAPSPQAASGIASPRQLTPDTCANSCGGGCGGSGFCTNEVTCATGNQIMCEC